VNAASFQSGVAPGAWITIFGQNLAPSEHALATPDLVNGSLPTSLDGVSVKIDNQPAFLQYVSPAQINVQAPADTNSGTVQVTVTTAAGTSDPVTATLQSVFPAFFVSQNYVAAVRADGTVVASGQSVKPGDALSLYGTGFGPVNPSVTPGALVLTAASLIESVTLTVGGIETPVGSRDSRPRD
jgi:uncharacterized protein (TIGR03437 family)